jgi:hypothetical protein
MVKQTPKVLLPDETIYNASWDVSSTTGIDTEEDKKDSLNEHKVCLSVQRPSKRPSNNQTKTFGNV